ncbi:protein HIRA-like [Paramacrobiotus metropolitanus]|uniref:protein HIRA-like n=1 Tax=Paramacrobiotus metropolitanus TaxID=2943436 RepID=UPI0024459875|nr:protein HIRA-like [Paramacrobiotus metropolitanus]
MAKDGSEPDTSRQHLKEIIPNGNHARTYSSRIRPEDRGRAFIMQLKFTNFDKSLIYAIDVHPDGTRFAAGGMGDDSGRLCIWHINSLKPDRVDIRLITQLDNHTACVNCLRWSHKGNYLASGAGDSLVMIWQQTRIGEAENWRRVHALHKHTADVLGVNWSPNDAMLASCSVDNSIIIWDVQKNFESIIVLKEQNGTVKGVVWDPIGKYLATQSDERIKVWRTADWKLQHNISDFFDKCHGSTQVLRLDWSTDGMNIISSHATNEGRPVAQIIERGAQDAWKSVNYFAGHSRPVVCVRFNPRMFTMKDENTPYCVCATGSRDHNICVWTFQHKRPHVFTGLFDAPVMDISWFPDGYSMLACGLDGKIAYIYCGKLITGKAITKDQQSQALTKLYGKSVLDTIANLLGSNTIVESSVFLDAQEAEKRRKDNPQNTSTSSAQPAQLRLPYEGIPLTKQIETRLPDGRLRITPVFIPESVPQPMTSFGMVINGAHSDSTLDERSQQSNSAVSDGVKEEPAAPPVPMSRPLGPSALKAASRSVVSLPKKPEKVAVAPPPPKKVKPVENGEKAVEKEKKKTTTTSDKAPVGPAPNKRSAPAPAAVENVAPVEKDVEIVVEKSVPKPALLDSVLKKSAPQPVDIIKHAPRPDRRPGPPTGRRLPLPPLLPKLTANVEHSGGIENGDTAALVVENEIEPGNLSLLTRFHKIQYLIGGRARWIQYLASPIVLVATNENVCCTICQDHSLNVWSSDSGSLLASHFLSAAGVQLACSKNAILVITADAKVDMWKRLHVFERWRRQSLGSIEWMLRSPGGIVNVVNTNVTETEVPVVTLSDHRCFICDISDLTWSVVHDDVIRFGNYLAVSGGLRADVLDSGGPLSKLQKIRSGSSVGRNVSPEVSRTLLLNHMEKQMHLARVLKSPSEYQSWQLGYVQFLVDNDSVLRLRTLLDSLMGPPGNTEDLEESTWEPEILGIAKRAMLEKLLPLLGRKTQFQRMFIEYRQRLDLFGVRNLFATQDH